MKFEYGPHKSVLLVCRKLAANNSSRHIALLVRDKRHNVTQNGSYHFATSIPLSGVCNKCYVYADS